jgi:hypothetical protein
MLTEKTRQMNTEHTQATDSLQGEIDRLNVDLKKRSSVLLKERESYANIQARNKALSRERLSPEKIAEYEFELTRLENQLKDAETMRNET